MGPAIAMSALIDAVATRSQEFDLIHWHIGWLHLPMRCVKTPCLTRSSTRDPFTNAHLDALPERRLLRCDPQDYHVLSPRGGSWQYARCGRATRTKKTIRKHLSGWLQLGPFALAHEDVTREVRYEPKRTSSLLIQSTKKPRRRWPGPEFSHWRGV